MAVIQGRTPRGVRGLKYFVPNHIVWQHWSHPSRGAWIEIPEFDRSGVMTLSRTPRGVRGLKSRLFVNALPFRGRTPRGVRGLKLLLISSALMLVLSSHPSRGAWIEINKTRKTEF